MYIVEEGPKDDGSVVGGLSIGALEVVLISSRVHGVGWYLHTGRQAGRQQMFGR